MACSKVNVMILVLLSVSFAFSKTILTASSASDNLDVEAVESVAKDTMVPNKNVAELDMPIPGRVSCPHIDATEDQVCLEHCLPKGYSYGICVSNTCSCV